MRGETANLGNARKSSKAAKMLLSQLLRSAKPLKRYPNAEIEALTKRAEADALKAEEAAALEAEENARLVDALAVEDGKSTDWIGAVAAELGEEDSDGVEGDDLEVSSESDDEEEAEENDRDGAEGSSDGEEAEEVASDDDEAEVISGDDLDPARAPKAGDLAELQSLARAAASTYGEFASSNDMPSAVAGGAAAPVASSTASASSSASAAAPGAAAVTATATAATDDAIDRATQRTVMQQSAGRWRKSVNAATQAVDLLQARHDDLKRKTKRSDSKTGKKRSKRDRDAAQASLRVATRQLLEMLLSRAQSQTQLGRVAAAKDDVAAGLKTCAAEPEGAAVEGLEKQLKTLNKILLKQVEGIAPLSARDFAAAQRGDKPAKRGRGAEEAAEAEAEAEAGDSADDGSAAEADGDDAAAGEGEPRKKRAKKEKRAPRPKVKNPEAHAVWKAKQKGKAAKKIESLSAAQIAARKQKFAAKKARRAAAKAAAAAAAAAQ